VMEESLQQELEEGRKACYHREQMWHEH